jgi:phosphodiesterase/alkaline phosphatase D-like protein
MVSRRSFFKFSGAVGVFSTLQSAFPDDSKNTFFSSAEVRVFQGPTTSQETIICVVAHRTHQIQFQIIDSKNQKTAFAKKLVDLQLGEFVIHHIELKNLKLEEEYSLEIRSEHNQNTIVRKFKTLNLKDRTKKIALLSCSNHRNANPKGVMFKNLFATKPDAIFHLGDFVYANSVMDTILKRPAQPHEAYQVFVKTFMEFEIFNQINLIPIFSIWDDHDLAYNNSDESHPYKDTMLQIYRGFFPLLSINSLDFKKGPGTSFVFNAFGLQFIFTDSRFFKNADREVFWGSQQLDWMQSEILSNKRPKVILSSQQFFQYNRFTESLQKQAPGELNELLSLFNKINLPFMFISGDVHYSQVQHFKNTSLNQETYEITSSAFFSNSAGDIGKRNPKEGQLCYYGKPNYLTFQQKIIEKNSLDIDIFCISESSKSQFYHRLNFDLETRDVAFE